MLIISKMRDWLDNNITVTVWGFKTLHILHSSAKLLFF